MLKNLTVWFLFLGIGVIMLAGCGSSQGISGQGWSPNFDMITSTSYPPAPPVAAKPLTNSTGPAIAAHNGRDRSAVQIPLTQGWNTISFPLQNVTAASGFAYHLYRFNGSGYDEIDPVSHPEAIDCRYGYWAYADNAGNASADGSPNSTIYRLNLNYGWNFLGMPFSSEQAYSSINLTYGWQQSLANASTLSIPPEADKWVYARFYYYTGNAWVTHYTWGAHNLQPNFGYWLWCWNNSGQTTFDFPSPPAPAITSLNPNNGGIGYNVTITGTGFGGDQGGSTVSFTGFTVADYLSWSDTQIEVLVPNGSYPGDVVVHTGWGDSNGVYFNVFSSPYIANIYDNPAPVGAQVNVWGDLFGDTQGSSTVSFNGALATNISYWSNNHIILLVPNGASSGIVLVEVNGVLSNNYYFTVGSSGPHINSLSPDNGPVGSYVTIAGYSFGSIQSNSTVTFNGFDAGSATFWSDSQIVAQVPFGASSGDVLVNVNGQLSNGVNFNVTTSPGITSLYPWIGLAGTATTVTGNNFGAIQGTSSVTFNGTGAGAASLWNDTQIVINVPGGATSGDVIVNVGGQASNPVTMTVCTATYSLSGTVSEIDGTAVSGGAVTVMGTGFATTTDGTGAYTLNNVPSTRVVIRVSKTNYIPIRRGYNLYANSTAVDLPLVRTAALNPAYYPTDGKFMLMTRVERVNAIAPNTPLPDAYIIENPDPGGYVSYATGSFPGSNTYVDWVDNNNYSGMNTYTSSYSNGFIMAYDVEAKNYNFTAVKNGYSFSSFPFFSSEMTTGEILFHPIRTSGTPPTTFTVGGTLKDATGSPLAGVSVEIYNTAISGTTDSSGNFSLSGVPYGSQLLRVNRSNFNPAYMKFNDYIFVSQNITDYRNEMPTAEMVTGILQNGRPLHQGDSNYSYNPSATTGTLIIQTRLHNRYSQQLPGLTLTATGGTWYDQGYMWDKTSPPAQPQETYAIDWEATYTYEAGMKMCLNGTPGSYNVTGSAAGYEFGTESAQVFAGEVTMVSVHILKPALYDISGTLADYSGSPVSGATLGVSGRIFTTTAPGTGAFTLSQVPSGSQRWLSCSGDQSYIPVNYDFPLFANRSNLGLIIWSPAQFNYMANGKATYDNGKYYTGLKFVDVPGGTAMSGVTFSFSGTSPAASGYMDVNGRINNSLTSTSATGTAFMFDTSSGEHQCSGSDGSHYFNTLYISSGMPGGITIGEIHTMVSPRP